MMQSDAYTGAYDEYAKASYEYVAKACNLDVDNFNATDSAFNVTVPDTTSNICVSGNTYITKDGDSCDSIALAQGVSAATMYYINSNIFDCHKIATGTELCLPLTCTKIYKVKQADTCLDIAMNANILQDKLLSFNSQLNWNCTNLHDADPYWGSTLCVSTPGGTYSGQPLNNTEPFEPEPIDPPNGAPVANGTTKECSHWFTNDGSLSCTQICLAYDIPINLFTATNPSLSKSTCDTDLVVGNAYCLKPVNGWDLSDGTETASPTATATKSATSTNSVTSANTAAHTSTAEKVPSPTQPGIVDGCNKWHYVDNGDGCYSIAEKYHVELADFYTWNSKVGNDCSGLWLHYYVCVGVAS
jgi:LysM repeat protein